MYPKISVIVPCYNQAQYLDECLQSVLEQTYQDWECIIVNDGSPDNTEEVAFSWTVKDARFKYLKKENGGLSSARNAGIEKAKGEWILPLDADDKIGNQYLELAISFFKNENIKIIYCQAEFFGKMEGHWNLPPYSLTLLALRNIIFCSAFFKKDDWEKVNGYDENLKEGWEDWEFWIHILKTGGDVVQINSVQFFYRRKDMSLGESVIRTPQISKRIKNYITLKHADFYQNNFGNSIELYIAYREIANSRAYKIGRLLTAPVRKWREMKF